MNWKQIDRNKRVQHKGVYSDWKEQIASECYHQCVYCSINEAQWGGIDHYHIDHFRPQSKFKELKDTITNLYYACPICNKFKSNDWQNECDNLDLICYPDPSDYNYSDLFSLDTTNHTITGSFVASKYLINRLYLNRPQLVYDRRENLLNIKAEVMIAEANKLINLSDDLNLIKEVSLQIVKLVQHLLTRSNISPYKLTEIKKPKKK